MKGDLIVTAQTLPVNIFKTKTTLMMQLKM